MNKTIQKSTTRFAQMTNSPEALAVWLDKIYNGYDTIFANEYCKSDCEDPEDCQHELQCITAWLNERVDTPITNS